MKITIEVEESDQPCMIVVLPLAAARRGSRQRLTEGAITEPASAGLAKGAPVLPTLQAKSA